MGKVKAWLMEMEDDALEMTRDEFIEKYSEYEVDIWDRVNKVDADSYIKVKRGMDCFMVRGL
tara:strand:- start:363 stop:548 length:186 start_codon:yes stop_codon:yes gene_type:complete